MKIRWGFVSNSSSSSFICEICNLSESGWDASPEDLGFVQCINEHIMCEEHLLDTERDSEDKDYFSESCCPICQFVEYSNRDLAKYLEKFYKVERNTVFDEIKKVNKRRRNLYDFEYVDYVLKQNNLTDDIVLANLKTEFKTYKDFMNFIYNRNN